MKKTLFKIAGYVAVALGFAGVFVPLFPTTPFLLLAVYCFTKGDLLMNQWLLHNRFFGKYLLDYESGRGIPLAVKITSLVTMWSSMLFTAFVFVDNLWVRLLLFVIPLFVSIHILEIKTLSHEAAQDRDTRSDTP